MPPHASLGYGVVDVGSLADSWRQATGTSVWGTPYGPYSERSAVTAGGAAAFFLQTAKQQIGVGRPLIDVHASE